MGYAAFHLGDYKRALDVYMELSKTHPKGPEQSGADKKDKERESTDGIYNLYAACCQFYLGNYKEAEELALKGPSTRLQNRLLFHISHKQNDETQLMKYHAKLSDKTEDQLSLASIHYLRNHFQEATDIYKRLLIEFRDYLALQVYVAMW